MAVSVSVIGASGYSGGELLRIFTRHTKIDEISATSRSHAGKRFSDVLKDYPVPEGKFTPEEKLDADIVFTATPSGVAMALAKKIDFERTKLIDISGDFRLPAKTYEEWYGLKHTAPELLKLAVYGLTEINREKIKRASLVSNPGCYPTGALLALAPLAKRKLIKPPVFIDSKSGVSGAGHQPEEWRKKAESFGYYMPYGIPRHKHTPEIEQMLRQLAGKPLHLSFSPMLMPVFRGIYTNAHCSLSKKLSQEKLDSLYSDFYKGERFVKVLRENMPNIKRVEMTNNCEICAKLDARTNSAIIISAIDNLVKGAAGQAVQNMNLMAGFPEETGLGIADKCGW